MTFPVVAFAFALSFAQIGEAWAETWNCGPQNSNGKYSNSVTCTYDETTKTFTIEGDGEMGNYYHKKVNGEGSSTAPWINKNIEHAEIKGNVTSIGDRVFEYITTLRDISGTENIKTIGEASFAYTNLTSADFSSATYVKRAAFYGAENLEYIALGENVVYGNANDGRYAFVDTKIPNCHISGDCGTCNGYIKRGTGCVAEEDCKDGYTINKESKMCNKIAGCSSFVDGACVCDKYYYKKEGGCVSFEEGCGSGWLEKNRECIEASEGCGENYKDLGGWCNRVIYTPAEAAPLLTDENNMVTITFRK